MLGNVPRFSRFGLVSLLAACHGGGSSRPSAPPPSVAGGLDARPSNAACLAPPRDAGTGAAIALERAFPDLTFDQPVAMLEAPGDSSRWYLVERPGRVEVFANDPSTRTASTFIDLRSRVDASGEGGLLGFAFDPDYAANGRVFMSWTETGAPLVSVIGSFTATADGAALDPSSEQTVLRLNQPFTNHNGGNVAFGPDGLLYIGFGDGGSGGDPFGYAQNTKNFLGAMLRLDVRAASPYAIPSDNPFAGNPMCPADPNGSTTDCPEIYAWGFRNPWRWSFDPSTGELWVGDVGQNAWEEVDRVERGGNYGWDCMEGTHPYSDPAPSCAAATGLIPPVAEYSHSEGNSITGGYVYRGTAVPGLVGSYLFADYGSGRIWRLAGDGTGGRMPEELLDTAHSIASFAEGGDGELYVLDIADGGVYKIVPATGGGAASGPPVPALLSATGCVEAANAAAPAPGLIPYDVAAPFWSDGADKERWLAVPDGTTVSVDADGKLAFPPRSVLVKSFRANGKLIETRLFMRHPDGGWAGYTYEWNAAQTDAALVEGGKTADIGGGATWIFPSEDDCLVCHTAAAGFVLGVEAAQLNHDFTYPSTGRTANQLETLDAVGLFDAPLGPASAQPKLPDPFDAAAPLGDRARAYLHSNCAGCHRPQGPTGVALDLRYSTALAETGACDAPPQAGDLGLGADARLVAPGAPDRSVLLARMSRRDANGMPPLASAVADAAGAALIGDWIASLAGCQ
ncbi:MAG TPA: PQQ-dependent sugar dehydrogenase [Gammaproteobacteria bacterium]|nr:PQQ-dependent sugar dehydrogenase [Gammaproteobacteria bacterium]